MNTPELQALVHEFFENTSVIAPGEPDPVGKHDLTVRTQLWRLWRDNRRLREERIVLNGRAATLDHLEYVLKDVTDVILTLRHPEYGIECTVARTTLGEDAFVTVINQPDGITGILNAYGALLSDTGAG